MLFVFQMWEILAGTGACIPVPAREMAFNMAASRVDLARRLFRVFYSEEDMALARSLYQLPDSAIILPAIIGKPVTVSFLRGVRPY